MEERIGLIDIGSNTIRLVIFGYNKKTGLNEILNIKTPARLSQYLTKSNEMNDEGIHVLKETLSSFRKVADKFNVDALYPIATAAIRQSKNREAIIKEIKQDIHIEIQIVPEEDEAFYGYYAITHTTDIENGISVDIGGGSTEVTLFKDKQLKEAHSFPFGVVSLKRQFFGDKAHNDKTAIKNMEQFLREQFSQLDWLSNQHIALVGVGGSARNVARIHQSAHAYPIGGVHNYKMTSKDINNVYDLIRKSSRDELTNLDGLSRDRVDIILPAISVFKTLFKKIDATQFTFSANRRVKLAQSLLNQIISERSLNISAMEKELFIEGSYIYYLGSFIDSDSSSPHTYYLIANSMINGFSHKDRVKLALLASFKNKSLLKFYCKETQWFSNKEIDTIQALGGIIKFANTLNISHTSFVEEVKLKAKKDDKYDLLVYYKGSPIAEEYQANRQKKHIEKILKGKVSIIFTKS
ncbi:MAG: exopolyphosphatase [Staphylococcus epidermidis]|nr:exopolyphosphatase [Staphylococcus epidermidis]